MGDEVGTSDWHGTIGRLAAWWLNSGFRRLADVLVMGDGRSIVLHEISTIAGGDEVVLDLGAGSGYFSIPIAEMLESGKVLCLDLSEEMLSSLEHKASTQGIVTSHHRGAHGPFSVGDMKALLLGAGLIDVTVETKRMMLVARAAMPG